jgi:hypothetical protein
MNESNLSRLNSFGWDTLKFDIDNSILEVPNNSMLSALMHVPILNKSFITRILNQYDLLTETAIKIKPILCGDNLDTFWKDVMLVIFQDKNIDGTKTKTYEQLYAMLSLPTYRINRQLQLQLSDDVSTTIFQEFSNLAIKNIRYDLQHPLPFDLITEEFCKNQYINYELFKYNKSIIEYFWNMIPQPFRSTPVYENDRKWNDYVRGTFEKRMLDPENELLLPENEKLIIYDEKRNESERRMSAFYSDYCNAKKYVSEFSLMRHENCHNFFTEWFKENDKKPGKNLSEQRSLRKDGMIEQVRCQCQFCFHDRALPRKAGKYTWHCEKPECKEKYRNWINELNSKGIELENLYKR